MPAPWLCGSGGCADGGRCPAKAEIRGLAVWTGGLFGTGLHRQSAQTLIHHAPDAGVRTENRLKTLLLLLQAMGCKKEKWAGTQAGDSAAVQQKRKLGN